MMTARLFSYNGDGSPFTLGAGGRLADDDRPGLVLVKSPLLTGWHRARRPDRLAFQVWWDECRDFDEMRDDVRDRRR